MSAGLQLAEPVVSALVTRLQSGLAAEIAIQNAEVTDGYLLDTPDNAQILDYVPPPSQLFVFPTIGIQLGPSTFEDDNAFTATGVYDLTIVCFVQESEQEALARKIMRYARCITRVALSTRKLSPAWGTVLVRIDYGPTLTETEEPRAYLSWFGVTIRAKTDED